MYTLCFHLEIRLSFGVAPLIHSACMRGKTVFLIIAPHMFTVYTMEASFVISKLAPLLPLYTYIHTLSTFYFTHQTYTRIYTRFKNSPHCSKTHELEHIQIHKTHLKPCPFWFLRLVLDSPCQELSIRTRISSIHSSFSERVFEAFRILGLISTWF